ncbi:MAG: adenylate/guanylate cyclase domain-containing protein, partial [Mesorhizobium sp.]
MGDGILAYFGWPKAQEDAAERAVKAALRIVAAAGGIKTQEVPHLRARIGIATGLVVIGSLGEGEAERPDEIVGVTPNLAARLQQAAGPDQVVISETTRHLVGGIFDLE